MKSKMRHTFLAIFALAVMVLVSGCGTEEQRIEGYISKGEKLYQSGKIEEASDAFKQAVNVNPELTETYREIAEFYETRDSNKAAEYYTELIELNPGELSYYLSAAECYEKANNTSGMIEIYGQGIAEGLSLGTLHELRGSIYYEIGDYDNAINDYKEVSNEGSSSSTDYQRNLIDAYIKSGDIAYSNGDFIKAVQCYTDALEISTSTGSEITSSDAVGSIADYLDRVGYDASIAEELAAALKEERDLAEKMQNLINGNYSSYESEDSAVFLKVSFPSSWSKSDVPWGSGTAASRGLHRQIEIMGDNAVCNIFISDAKYSDIFDDMRRQGIIEKATSESSVHLDSTYMSKNAFTTYGSKIYFLSVPTGDSVARFVTLAFEVSESEFESYIPIFERIIGSISYYSQGQVYLSEAKSFISESLRSEKDISSY